MIQADLVLILGKSSRSCSFCLHQVWATTLLWESTVRIAHSDRLSADRAEKLLLASKTTARKELILLHDDRTVAPGSTRLWLKVSMRSLRKTGKAVHSPESNLAARTPSRGAARRHHTAQSHADGARSRRHRCLQASSGTGRNPDQKVSRAATASSTSATSHERFCTDRAALDGQADWAGIGWRGSTRHIAHRLHSGARRAWDSD